MPPEPPSPSEPTRTLLAYFTTLPSGVAEPELLETVAERFVRLKRRLGLRFVSEASDLRDFLSFLRDRGIRRAPEFSENALRTWRLSLSGLAPSRQDRSRRAVGEFLEHLHLVAGAPPYSVPSSPARRRIPYRAYLFTQDQLRLLLARADLPGPWQRRARVYALISACGLRVSEACRLRLRDFDAERGTIFLERCKFNKDRLVPLPPSARERLRVDLARSGTGRSPEAPFFVDEQGRPFTAAGLSRAFHGDLVAWGLYEPTREVGGVRYGSTRLYSLRHGFATGRLLRWYREGADVQAKLPLLSTYLGHRSIRETQVYLHLTALVLREAHGRFADRWEKEFPLKP